MTKGFFILQNNVRTNRLSRQRRGVRREIKRVATRSECEPQKFELFCLDKRDEVSEQLYSEGFLP